MEKVDRRPLKVKFHYFRDKNHHPIAVASWLSTLGNNKLAFGLSVCNKKAGDQFHKKTGRAIAAGYAAEAMMRDAVEVVAQKDSESNTTHFLATDLSKLLGEKKFTLSMQAGVSEKDVVFNMLQLLYKKMKKKGAVCPEYLCLNS